MGGYHFKVDNNFPGMFQKIAWLTCLHFLVCIPSLAQHEIEWGEAMPMDEPDEDVQIYRLPAGQFYSIEYNPNTLGKQIKAKLFNERGKKIKQEKFKFQGQSAAVPYLDYHFTSYNWRINKEGNLLYVLEFPGKGRNPSGSITLKAYNADLKLLSEKKYLLPPEMDLLKVNTFAVENKNLVISCTHYSERPKIFGKKMPDYKLLYYILREGEEGLRAIPVELPGAVAHHAQYVFEGQNNFLVYGLYSGSKTDLAAGAFFVRYNMAGEQVDKLQMRDFPESITKLVDRRKKGWKKPDGDEVPNFKIYDIYFRKDGGLQFIAEQSDNFYATYAYQSTYGGVTTTSTVSGTVYQYDDVLIYTLYDDPLRDWFSLIRKRQSALGTDRDFSISHHFGKDGTTWLLYNDLPENLKIPITEEPDNLKNGRNRMATVLCTVDPKGNIEKKLLFTKKDLDLWFVPQATQFPGDGTALLTVVSKKMYRIGKLKVEE